MVAYTDTSFLEVGRESYTAMLIFKFEYKAMQPEKIAIKLPSYNALTPAANRLMAGYRDDMHRFY